MKFVDKVKEWGKVLVLSLPRSKMESEGITKGTKVEIEIKKVEESE